MFEGIIAASLTPIYDDFTCNFSALVDHCNDLLNRGCSGIALFGTTGEGPSFSADERVKALDIVVNNGLDPKKIILGISSTAMEDVIIMAKAAEEKGCLATLLAPPFFYKNIEESGVINFYREIIQSCESDDLKIILYHIPQLSGVPITLNIIEALKNEFPQNVIGIKESEGNLSFTKELLTAFPGFKVFVGKETHISEAVEFGAAGAITGNANSFPELLRTLYDFGKDGSKPDHNDVAKNLSQAMASFPIFPAIKRVLEYQKGPFWHHMRPPQMPLNEQQSLLLLEGLAKIGCL